MHGAHSIGPSRTSTVNPVGHAIAPEEARAITHAATRSLIA
jgi:hypothetical protein